MNPREIARNSSKKSLRRPSREPLSRRRRVDGALLPSAHVINTRDKRTPAPSRGMNTQSPAIVRGSDQRTRMIVSSSSAAALSAASLFLAVVSPSGARAFAVQLYLLAYDIGRVSDGSGSARSLPVDRRNIAACRGTSVEHGCIISNSAVAQRMVHRRAAQLAGDSRRYQRAQCCVVVCVYAYKTQKWRSARAQQLADVRH